MTASDLKHEDLRPVWPRLFMEWAAFLAQRSSCSRARVGCIITNETGEQVLGFGYNGNYKGGPNTCDAQTEGTCGCLHAEVNALVKVGVGDPRKIIYCTTIPCPQCAKLIVNSSALRVFYNSGYRAESETRNILESSNIDLINIPQNENGRFVEAESIGYNS